MIRLPLAALLCLSAAACTAPAPDASKAQADPIPLTAVSCTPGTGPCTRTAAAEPARTQAGVVTNRTTRGRLFSRMLFLRF